MPRKIKKAKKPINTKAVAVGVIVAVVLIVAGWFLSTPLRQASKAQHDVDSLLGAIDLYVKEQAEYPSGDFATICKLLEGQSIGGQNSRKLDYVEGPSYEKNSKGEFLDPWGSPYQFDFNTNKIRVYSCGPNKADDHGQSDDILARHVPLTAL